MSFAPTSFISSFVLLVAHCLPSWKWKRHSHLPFTFLYCYFSLDSCLMCKLIPFFGWFSYSVLPLYIKSHNIFVFIANVPCWDSWQYVLTLTIKGYLFKDISTQSDPSFTRARDISFENPSIGNNSNQFIALSTKQELLFLLTNKDQDTKCKGNCWSKPGHHRIKVHSYPSAQMTKTPALKNSSECSAYHLSPTSKG